MATAGQLAVDCMTGLEDIPYSNTGLSVVWRTLQLCHASGCCDHVSLIKSCKLSFIYLGDFPRIT